MGRRPVAALAAMLAAAGVLVGGASTASADAGVQACAWYENVDSWIMGHNQCPYPVKWEIGIKDPLGVQATYTPCVAPNSVRDIARRGTPLKGTVRC